VEKVVVEFAGHSFCVQWFEHVVDDIGSRLEFEHGDKGTSFFSSTELRVVGADVERAPGLVPLGYSLPVPPSSSSSSLAAIPKTEAKEMEEEDEEEGIGDFVHWRLSVQSEALGLSFCR
jgi:hypothetical protein